MPEVTMTKAALLNLWNQLPILSGAGYQNPNLTGFKLGYAVARTKNYLRPEIEALESALRPDPKYQEFDQKRLQICKKYAKTTPDGKLISEGGQYVFGENQGAFDLELAPLKKEYRDALETRDQQIEDYNRELKNDITVNIHYITEEDIPKNPEPTVAQMEVLIHFLKPE